MKKVLIGIKGMQINDGDDGAIEFMSEGVMRTVDGDTVLTYNDTGILSGQEKESVKTRVTVHGEKKVIIERSGGVSSRLIIEKGVRNDCLYSIPQGNLTLGIYGKAIRNGLTESGGELSMSYSIDANMRQLSENTIKISVKEV